MIHRIDSVNPDVDDRVIKPNQARAALNLRFGSSTEDTSLSGGILVNGNDSLPYNMPIGENLVTGVREDYESQNVYFSLWNSYEDPDTFVVTHNHGIYRIQSDGDIVDCITSGAWLNFSKFGDVSIAVIDGKLYWTDGTNPPRMINIEKGIRTQEFIRTGIATGSVYPTDFQDWYYSQIKREPGEAIKILFNGFTLADASVDYNDKFAGPVGYQFASYYIYDNDEESRLGPVSELTWQTKNISLEFPYNEVNTYLYGRNIVKQIVLCFREGNEGVWNVLKRIDNVTTNPLYSSDSFGAHLRYTIPDILFVARTAVSGAITNAQFDSVPLTSTCNIIAQSRIFHSNYTIDYPNWDGLTLTLTPNANQFVPGNPQAQNGNERTFMFGTYKVGIELLDEWGRRIGVVSSQTITINKPFVLVKNVTTLPVSQANRFDPKPFNEDKDYWTNYYYTISGTFPDWAKYYRVVYTRCLDYNYFYKTTNKLYYWFNANGVDYFSNAGAFITTVPFVDYTYVPPSSISSNDGKINYIFKGYAVEQSSGEPFEYDGSGNQYVAIAQEYSYSNTTSPPIKAQLVEYKIEKAVGTLLCFKRKNDNLVSTFLVEPRTAVPNYDNFAGQGMGNRFNVYYQTYLYSKKTSIDETYYQSTAIKRITGTTTSLSGIIYGDCYAQYFKKTNSGSTLSQLRCFYTINPTALKVGDTDTNDQLSDYATQSYDVVGYAFSMNPTNIFSQDWNSDFGQINIVNENQRESTLKNWITFSDAIILGSQINGLNKFNSLDSQAMPAENGPITGIITTNATQGQPGVMLAIGSLAVESIYLGAVQQTATDGESVMSLSTNVLGSHRPLMGQYGTKKLRSISNTPMSTIYWWSEVVNDIIRYSNAGLERLGQTYMFANAIRNALSGSYNQYTVFDQVTNEVVLISNNRDAFVFSERFKTFQGNRELHYLDVDGIRREPERAVGLSNKMYMFLDGGIWVSRIYSAPNSFFGQTKYPKLTLISNEQPAVEKQWNAYKLFGPSKPPLSTILTSGSYEGSAPSQISHIEPGWWIERKQDWEVAIRKDEKSLGGILSGKLMESRILNTTFVFDVDGFQKLNFIEVRSNKSVVQ